MFPNYCSHLMAAAIHKNYQLVHRPPRLIQVKTPEINYLNDG